MIIADPVLSWEHMMTFFAGSTALALVGHAVNTFPTPSNPYGQWLLGIIKFAVGQRQSATNALRGLDTVVAPVPRGMGTGTGQSTETNKTDTVVTPETITTETAKLTKTSVTVPNPNPNPGPVPDSTKEGK